MSSLAVGDEDCFVSIKLPKIMHYIIPHMFDCWADTFVLLKSSMVRHLPEVDVGKDCERELGRRVHRSEDVVVDQCRRNDVRDQVDQDADGKRQIGCNRVVRFIVTLHKGSIFCNKLERQSWEPWSSGCGR